jgi:hypothetical protein
MTRLLELAEISREAAAAMAVPQTAVVVAAEAEQAGLRLHSPTLPPTKSVAVISG